MALIRVRHPRGVTTIDIDPETQTIDDLKVLVFSATEIPRIKYGYPPKSLPSTSGTLSTIPITRGEQIIVTSVPAVAFSSSSAPASQYRSTPVPSVKTVNETLSVPSPLCEADIPIESSTSVALPGRDAGFLQMRVVPDDNSCLFSALGVVFEGGVEGGKGLRKGKSFMGWIIGQRLPSGLVVAGAIRDDPATYSEVVLGSRDDYIRSILKPDTWGGAIELTIFSKHYKTEISSFDVATGRCDRFGQDEYDSRCVLVYSGIHYDALTLSPLPVSSPSFHTTVFPISDTSILSTASELIAQLKARHCYTDTATFDLRCGVCQAGLKGEKGAREHAMHTGHVEFGEYLPEDRRIVVESQL